MKPTLLFYGPSSQAPDLVARSWVLAGHLSAVFDVVLVTDSARSAGTTTSPAVEVVRLPDVGPSRTRLLLDTFFLCAPAVVLTELFPFGHQTLTGEILPMLEYAAAARRRPLVVCSVLDVPERSGRSRKEDDSAALMADAFYDAILLHTDPRLATVEEAFGPRMAMRIPVMHTGLVTPGAFAARVPPDRGGIVVSAGCGRDGAPLFRAAIEAHALSSGARPPMRIVTGPQLPEDQAAALHALAAPYPDITIEAGVFAQRPLLASAALSISQCEYHTALDVLQSGVAAVVVPATDGGDHAQCTRADRLEALGVCRVLPRRALTGPRLAMEIAAARVVPPTAVKLNTDGAVETTRIVARLSQFRERWMRPSMASAS